LALKLIVRTKKEQEFLDISGDVERLVNIEEGVCVLYCPHTTAGLTINEGADPAVRADIINALSRLVPENMNYKHGEGNSPAHIKTTLMGNSLNILVEGGKLELGTWESIYLCEFDGPRERRILVGLIEG
jgi:secondary thiamine-phosphate synthase enzyme